MEPFTSLDAVAAPFPRPDIDTDQIFPARFLHKQRAPEFGRYLFHDLRFRRDGSEDPNFVLNRPSFRDARVIVAERNFACGSSRENAVWALYDFGIRAIIAPSFGDIFHSNCLKNGLLPIALPAPVVAAQLVRLTEGPGLRVKIDLPEQVVALPDGNLHHFEIGTFAKQLLVNGFDELDYTLSRVEEIDAFERNAGAGA